MAQLALLVAGLQFLVESQASDLADRSKLPGFLSKYMPSGSDAPRSSMSDYDKFITPNINRVKHHDGNGAESLSIRNNLAEPAPNIGVRPFTIVDDKPALYPTTQVQHPMAFNPITLSAIGIGLLSLATLLRHRLQRGLQPATVLASSGGLGPLMPMNTSALGDNVMEMHSQDPNIDASLCVLETRPVQKVKSNRVGWEQLSSQNSSPLTLCSATHSEQQTPPRKKVVVVGAGWAGLSTAWTLSKHNVDVTLVDAAARPGGVVRDGFKTRGGRPAEAGQHGFWEEYFNIYKLLYDELKLEDDPLTGYAEQGQYSPKGLEAIWPVYRDKQNLPTGLAQAAYTRFLKLSPLDLATAAPLVAAFSEFLSDDDAWERYDELSFKDLCTKLGVSKKLYREAFEPMILTGLFAPGEQCSAAAALGMAYFFVLKSQTAFDVRWCRGNIGDLIFAPWCEKLRERGVKLQFDTRIEGVELDGDAVIGVKAAGETIPCDDIVFAVGMRALKGLSKSPALASLDDFRKFGNLRGTDVLATRLFFDRDVETPYSANACWGFDSKVGQTWFDLKKLHAPRLDGEPGAVVEVDYYHAGSLLGLSDVELETKARRDLETMVPAFKNAKLVDAAVVRLPEAVNWYFPGSYASCPTTESESLQNAYFAGDVVRDLGHDSWSQEKAYVSGVVAANAVLGLEALDGVEPLRPDEPHVAAGAAAVKALRRVLSFGGDGPSLASVPW